MLCPKCKGKTVVKNSRLKNGVVHRRRKCEKPQCAFSATTIERFEDAPKPIKTQYRRKPITKAPPRETFGHREDYYDDYNEINLRELGLK